MSWHMRLRVRILAAVMAFGFKLAIALIHATTVHLRGKFENYAIATCGIGGTPFVLILVKDNSLAMAKAINWVVEHEVARPEKDASDEITQEEPNA